jgi:hypothetical protein
LISWSRARRRFGPARRARDPGRDIPAPRTPLF